MAMNDIKTHSGCSLGCVNSSVTNLFNYRFAANRLLVIVPDRVSEWLSKGEVISRYFNPGELFREVHILMINDDRPDVTLMQKLVGEAVLHLHNLMPEQGLLDFSRNRRRAAKH